jgi:hypothetical protein
MKVKSRKHGAISNALWQRQVHNRPPFKAIFLLGGKKTRSEAKKAILTRSGKSRL